MIFANNENSRLEACIVNLLEARLPNKYLADDKFIIVVISATACPPPFYKRESDEFEFTVRAHHNGRHPSLRELYRLADIFEDIGDSGFRGLHCMNIEFICDETETGENLNARFRVTRDLLEFHHF